MKEVLVGASIGLLLMVGALAILAAALDVPFWRGIVVVVMIRLLDQLDRMFWR